MYYIKDDKRSEKSAQLIYNALLECLKSKPLNKITITDIQQTSFVSRSTFYRHFDNISDILLWQCQCRLRQALQEYSPNDTQTDSYHFMQYFLQYWTVNSDILEILLQANRLDIIFTCHMNNIQTIADKFNISNFLTDHGNYFMGIRAGMMIGVIMTWLEGNKKETPEELCAILQEQFNFIKKNDLLL